MSSRSIFKFGLATARGAAKKGDFWLARFCSRSRLLSQVYYSVADRSFWRECRAVLSGKVEFIRRQHSVEGSAYLLRRNIHRLEKGLIMRPARPVFAADYIEQTVQAFRDIKDAAVASSEEDLAWARQVLKKYFSVVHSHSAVDRARAKFGEDGHGDDSIPRLPYLRDLTQPSPVNYEDLFRLARRRRSVRWFRPKRVSRDLIDKALLIAQQAPSACNRQPYRFIVFDEPAVAEEIGRIPGGATTFAHNFPAVAVVVGDLSAYFDERDRHAVYTDGSLAIMGFILALETLGVSSCCINWPDIESAERVMHKRLGLNHFERPIMVIALGYPDEAGLVPFSQKAPLASVRSYGV